MEVEYTERGFGLVKHLDYPADGEESRLVQESSAMGASPHPDPGSAFLWVGKHHLNRDEVRELASLMINWLATGHLEE